tara:strand:+ start:8722 stop:8979 length:258 start_codon:yes stop_codon:yes gene_type:complete
MSTHDGYTKKQLDEMEKNRWTQEKIEDAEWKIMENKEKIDYLDKAIADREKKSVLKKIRKDLREEKKKIEDQMFKPPKPPELNSK